MPDDNSEMSFWAHLDALRAVLLKAAIVVAILSVAYFAAIPWLFDHVIAAPCSGDFPTYRLLNRLSAATGLGPDTSAAFSVSLINIELASQFMVHVSASMWAALVTAIPLCLALGWSFVSPALRPYEKRAARPAFVWGCLMFYIGMAAGYFLVFPLALRFLSDYQLSDMISNTVSLTSYMDTFYTILLAMGLLFELPIVAWMLGKAGILSRAFFRKYRRHAIALILIAAGILTPTSDIFTLFAVFLPVYALWEGSALLIPKKQ